MELANRIRDWLKENAPMVTGLSENKYVRMVYDRFASLPGTQQRHALLGGLGGIVFLVFGYLFFSYISLWSDSGRGDRNQSLVDLLQTYQRDNRDKAAKIQYLERNSVLAAAGALRQHLVDQAKAASVSPKLIEADEKAGATPPGEDGKGGEVRIKEATVTLSRITLAQLKNFLSTVEFGQYNLSVSSLKVTNDDKLRGYMKAELGIVAYLAGTETSE